MSRSSRSETSKAHADEEVAAEHSREIGLTHPEIDDVIDSLCGVSDHREIHSLWRPFLRDPKDDMVLELAVASGAQFIVTHNLKDFDDVGQFGVEDVRPDDERVPDGARSARKPPQIRARAQEGARSER